MMTLERFGCAAEIDEAATRAWYEAAPVWDCDCGHCRNFLALARARRLPPALLEVLDALSIPPEKATYVCQYEARPEGIFYQVNYRLAGRLLRSAKEPGGMLAFAERDSYPLPAAFPEPNFDLQCWLTLPWVLPEPVSGPHHILFSSETEEDTAGIEALLREVISTALWCEGVEEPCEISVLLTDNEGIRAINREMRDVDAPTDVLSFPMFALSPGEVPGPEDADPETGTVPLGDMAISLERAAEQAREYGHPLRRELAYLAVHSVLHLLGYDHLDEGPQKRQMRAREEAILSELGITRED